MMKQSHIRDKDFESMRLDVSARCNNNCIFCSDSERQEISMSKARRLLEENKHLGEVTFSSGEPTLNPNLFELLKLAKTMGYRKVKLISNGRRFSYLPYCRKIVQSGVDEITISLHSCKKDVHNGLTRSRSFEETMQGLSNLAKTGVKVKVNCTVTEVNQDFEGFYEALKSLGLRQVNFHVMKPQGRGKENSLRLLPNYTETVRKFNSFLYQKNDKKANVNLCGIPQCVNPGGREYEKMSLFYKGDYLDNDACERKVKLPSCRECRFEPGCTGVWENYIEKFGCDEFQPIRRAVRSDHHMQTIKAVKAGVKRCGKLEPVHVGEIEALKGRISSAGLMMLLPGARYNLDKKELSWNADEAGDYTYILVGKDESDLQKLLRCTEEGDVSGAGKLLSYPACCIDRFSKMDSYSGDRDMTLMLAKESKLPFHWQLNNMINPFRLIDFFACSYNCERAKAYAESMAQAADWDLELLKKPVVYRDFNNYAILDGQYRQGRIRYSKVMTSDEFAQDFMEPDPGFLNHLRDLLRGGVIEERAGSWSAGEVLLPDECEVYHFR
jgi:cyclic pyranopterin phosphate synthase